MENYCKNIGGRASKINTKMAEYVFTGGVEFKWLMSSTTKDIFSREYNLTECLAENMNVTELLTINDHTYDDLVKFIIDNELHNGRYCNKAYLWADGQPDGGDEHNCVRFGNDSSNRMDDASCELTADTGFVCSGSLSRIHA